MALNSLDAMPGSYDYNTAKSRLNSALGWNLSDADTNEAFQKFGGNQNSQFSDASLSPVYDYFSKRGPSGTMNTSGTNPGITGPTGPTGPAGPTTPPGQTQQGPPLSTVPAIQPGQAPAPVVAPQASAPAPDAYYNTVRDAILNQITTDSTAPSLTDSTLAPQVSAFATTQNQGMEDALNRLAEQYAANGQLHSGAFDTAKQNLLRQAALDKASFGANLLGNEQNARRGALSSMLGLGSAAGAQDQSLAGQTNLANLGAGVTTNGQNLNTAGQFANLGLSSRLGLGDLGLRSMLGRGQLDLGTLQTLLGNQQANNVLGFNYANLGANLNRDAILNGILG